MFSKAFKALFFICALLLSTQSFSQCFHCSAPSSPASYGGTFNATMYKNTVLQLWAAKPSVAVDGRQWYRVKKAGDTTFVGYGDTMVFMMDTTSKFICRNVNNCTCGGTYYSSYTLMSTVAVVDSPSIPRYWFTYDSVICSGSQTNIYTYTNSSGSFFMQYLRDDTPSVTGSVTGIVTGLGSLAVTLTNTTGTTQTVRFVIRMFKSGGAYFDSKSFYIKVLPSAPSAGDHCSFPNKPAPFPFLDAHAYAKGAHVHFLADTTVATDSVKWYKVVGTDTTYAGSGYYMAVTMDTTCKYIARNINGCSCNGGSYLSPFTLMSNNTVTVGTITHFTPLHIMDTIASGTGTNLLLKSDSLAVISTWYRDNANVTGPSTDQTFINLNGATDLDAILTNTTNVPQRVRYRITTIPYSTGTAYYGDTYVGYVTVLPSSMGAPAGNHCYMPPKEWTGSPATINYSPGAKVYLDLNHSPFIAGAVYTLPIIADAVEWYTIKNTGDTVFVGDVTPVSAIADTSFQVITMSKNICYWNDSSKHIYRSSGNYVVQINKSTYTTSAPAHTNGKAKVCSGSTPDISYSGSYGNYYWFRNAPLGITGAISGSKNFTSFHTDSIVQDTLMYPVKVYYVGVLLGSSFSSNLLDSVMVYPNCSKWANFSTAIHALKDSICPGDTAALTADTVPGLNNHYAWSTGDTTKTIHPTVAGTYTVTVTNSCGCSATASRVVAIGTLPAVTAAHDSICYGDTATLSAAGGSTYMWSTGDSTASISVTSGAVFTVTVTGANGCKAVVADTVTLKNVIPSVNNDTVCSGSNGTLTASGGTSYVWSTGDSTASITYSSGGIYSVTVISPGCQATALGRIVINPVPAIISNVPHLCSGSTVALRAIGGTAYLWSTGSTSDTITLDTVGIYTVTVTNPYGCTAILRDTFASVYANPIARADSALICSGAFASLNATGGVSYQWSNGVSSSNMSTSSAGNYAVTVTNATGCTAVAHGLVTVRSAGLLSVASDSVCIGDTATLTAAGGTHYRWTSGDTLAALRTTVAGTYTVISKDSMGCLMRATGTVVALPRPGLTVDSATICSGDSAFLSASGGTSYLWSNGQNSASIQVTLPGTYLVTASNTFGCTTVGIATVTAHAKPTPIITESLICTSAYPTLTASGGNSYHWNTGDTAFRINTLSIGFYSLTATNTYGCSATTSVTDTGHVVPVFRVDSVTICAGDSAKLTAFGGMHYNWSTGDTTSQITVTSAGSYSVTAVNSGCMATASGVVTVNPLPIIGVTNDTVCSGTAGTLTASGGVRYVWSAGDTTSTIHPLQAGTFSVTATNEYGCTVADYGKLYAFCAPPVIIPYRSACADSFYSFIFDSLFAGTEGDQIEWSTNAKFDSSTILVSPHTIVVTVQTNATDTVWFRSRNSTTGCIGDSAISVLRVYPYPLNTFAHAKDTLIPDSLAVILIPNSQNGIKYQLLRDGTTITTVTGTGYALQIPVIALDTTVSFEVFALDSISGCNSQDTAIVTFKQLPAPPISPATQSTYSDSSVIFTFNNVVAGRGGDWIEWSTNMNFDSSTIAPSPTDIKILVPTQSSKMVWIRTKNSITGLVGKSVTAMAVNNRPASAFPTYVSLATEEDMHKDLPTTSPVGKTSGRHGTTLTGAATYSIPILLPAGTNGMAPNLSFEYNSQGKNGHLGNGWDIGGLSSISRGGANNFYDGKTGAISFTNDDHFILDGQLLVPITGSNGGSGTIYGKLIEDYSKVTSFGSIPFFGGPDHFSVMTKDGLVMEYGNTEDSKVKGNNGSITSWRLNKVIDQDGNYIEYKYYHEANNDYDPRITEIDYTANDNQGLQAYSTIQFSYAPRDDSYTIYTGGSQLDFKYLLSSVNISCFGKLFKTYDLAYGTDGISSQLQSVTEHGTNGTALNPTVFKYGTVPNLDSYVTSTDNFLNGILNSTVTYHQNDDNYSGEASATILNKRLLSADFNGDGYSDVLTIYQGVPTGAWTANLHNYQAAVEFMNPITKHLERKAILPTTYATSEMQSLNGFWYSLNMYLDNNTYAQGDHYYYTGDFLGTGRSGVLQIKKKFTHDLSHYPIVNPSTLHIESIKYFTFDNLGTVTSTDFDIPDPDNNDYAYTNEHWFYDGDFDGDGKTDYIIVTSNGAYVSFPGHTIPEFNIPIGANSFPLPNSIGHGCDSWLNINCPNSLVYVGDFNGDGKSDLFIVNDSTNYSKSPTVFDLATNSSGGYSLQSIFSYSGFTKTDHGIVNYYPGDFNGDGKTDMLIRNSTTNKFISPVLSPPVISPQIHYINYYESVPNLTDKNSRSHTEWRVWFSTGSTFTNPIKIKDYDYTPYRTDSGKTFDPLVGDYNGDGKSDILFDFNQVRLQANGDYNYALCTDLAIYYSKGNSFDLHNIISGASNLNMRYAIAGDFNGDGRADVSFYNLSAPMVNTSASCSSIVSAGVDYAQLSFNPKGQERLLQEVLDGFNQLKIFKYALLTEPGEHKIGNTNVYPLLSVQPGMPVVAQTIVPDGAGGLNITDYRYEDARVHRGGKGFLGFSNIDAISHLTGMTTSASRTFNPPYYVPTTTHSKVFLNNSSTGISENYSFYTILPLGNPSPTSVQRCAIQKHQEFNVNVLGGSYQESDYQYDAYGNIVSATVDINGIQGTTTRTTFALYGGTVPAKPTQVNITKTRIGAPSFNDMTLITYDHRGHRTGMISGFGKDCAVGTGWQYDGFGNVKSETTLCNTSTGGTRNKQYQYDNSGRLATVYTNPLGQDELTYYDVTGQLWSKPTIVTHIDQTTDEYLYDAFGRQVQSVNPRGVSLSSTYSWSLYHNGSQSVYSVLSHSDGAPDATVWNDALEREVFKSVKGFGTQGDVLLSTNYNDKGSISSKVGPYYASNTTIGYLAYDYANPLHPLSPTSIYDQFGSSSVTYSYASDGAFISHTTDAAGRQKEKTIDPAGKIIKSSDNGGTLSFKYDGNGNQTEVDMDGHAVLVNTYDPCNHISQTSEPNGGTKNYHYDGYGQMLSQIDANSHTYQMIYDVAGRVISRRGSQDLTLYTYYPVGQNGVNQVHEIHQSQNGTPTNSQSFEYNSYGQTKKLTDFISGQPYSTEYFYYSDGKIQYVKYPSGYAFGYGYDVNGYLLNVKNVSTSHTMYSVKTMNEYGQATTYTTGNGKTSTLNTAYGIPIRYTTPGVQDLELTYDWPSRDLLQRTDHTQSSALTETFTYDNLDRLLSSQVGSYTPMTYTYANNGNLTSKTDAGSYTYDGAKINATKHVTNPYSNISSNTQDITYTGSNKAAAIVENGYELDYTYGPDDNRKTSMLKNGGTLMMKHLYSGTGYEEIDDQTGNPKRLHYINGINGLAVIVISDNYGNIDEHYVYTDQLGSIVAVTDSSGTIEAQQNFDSWGRKRNPADWSYSNVPSVPSWLYRGYTGHEQLEPFTLINMNGRMYDPLLGQMLSPDIVLHDESETQSYNRYSYASNNPMKYIDPSGWEWIGGDYNNATNGVVANANPWETFWGNIYGAIALSNYRDPSIQSNSLSLYSSFQSQGQQWIDNADFSGESTSEENDPEKAAQTDKSKNGNSGPGAHFQTLDAAAIDFHLSYNQKSLEYRTQLFFVREADGTKYYTYSTPETTNEESAVKARYDSKLYPDNYFYTGSVHTHGDQNTELNNNYLRFTTDYSIYEFFGLNGFPNFAGYISTPNGSLYKYSFDALYNGDHNHSANVTLENGATYEVFYNLDKVKQVY